MLYNKEFSITDYLIWGGLPGRLAYNQEEDIIRYLRDIEETIIYRNLINRYKIKNVFEFKKVVYFILKNNSRIYSIRSIYNTLKNDYPFLALTTVARFIDALKDSFIIDSISQYSSKSKKELSFYGKIYNADVGFNSIKVNNKQYDLTHNLENIIYNELLFRGYALNVYKTDKNEIDFFSI